MARMKIRVAGAWVDSNRQGKVNYQGSDLAYGPPAGPTYETINLGTPTLTDLQDGDQAYNMGMEFSIVASRLAYGVSWRVPDSVVTPPGGTHAVAIWNDDTNTRVGYKEFTPVPGGFQDILFDTPITVSNGINYVVSVYTMKYVFKAGAPSGLTSPSGNIVAGTGRLATYNGGAINAPIPEDSFSSTYFVSPLLGTS